MLIFCCRWLFWNARQLLRPLNVRVEHLEPLYWSVEKLHDLECILPPLLHSPSTQRSRRPPRRWADEMPSARRTPALTSSGQPPQRQPVAHPTGLRRQPWRKARVQKISRLRVGLHIARRRNRQARMGCSVLGRGAEPPQFWVLLIWLEPGISHVTWVHYDATMCLACFVCSILPVLHFLRFDLCVL